MKNSHLIRLAGTAAILFALAACHDAIFATIETEKKSATNTLSATLNVVDIEVAAPGSGVYDVAAGGVFQGTLSGAGGTISWNPNSTDSSRPFNPSGQISNVMTSFGGALYAGFTDQSGTTTFRTASAASPTSWTAIPIPGGWQQVTFLEVTNGTLFAGVCDSSNTSYALYSSTNGSTWTATGLTGTMPFVGVGWDGVNYWAVTRNYSIFEGGSPTTMSMVYPTGAQAVSLASLGTDTINGIFADAPRQAVFIVTKTTGVFYSTNRGASWTHINADQPSGSANPASYLCVAGPVDTSAGNTTYLLGSDGFGYYTLNTTTTSFSRFGDTTILLFSASISDILIDTSFGQENVFFGTNAQGVWRGVFDPTLGEILSGTNQYWIHE